MEVTKARHCHGLRLALFKSALQFLFRIEVCRRTAIVVVIAVVVVIVLISSFSNPSGVSLAPVLFFVRADAVLPPVLPVPNPEILHEGPVVGFVAFDELLEEVGTAAEELFARDVGGA